MTAQEARNIRVNANRSAYKYMLDPIYKEIEKLSMSGQKYCLVQKYDNHLIEILEQDGYSVLYSSNKRDCSILVGFK
jgi:hypothetical protein